MDRRGKITSLEFEQFPAQSDVKISKPFRTTGGDTIRALITPRGKVILTVISSDDTLSTVTVEGGPQEDAIFFWAEAWDKAKEIAGAVAGVVIGGGGGGGKCTTTTDQKFEDGKLVSQTTTTTCTS